jgi:hypothetical protein
MAEATKTVAQVLNELGVKLSQLIKERDAEITRLDNLPAAAKRSGKATYIVVDGTNPKAAEKVRDVNAGMVTKTGIEAYVTQKLIKKVEVPKGAVNTEYVKYAELTKSVRSIIVAMGEAALSRKPKSKARSSTGGGGNHAITKAWFDKHAKDCPKEMGVAWDEKESKITYNLPKGGRGATVSHGALNNILKAYKANGGNPAKPANPPKAVPAKVAPEKVSPVPKAKKPAVAPKA